MSLAFKPQELEGCSFSDKTTLAKVEGGLIVKAVRFVVDPQSFELERTKEYAPSRWKYSQSLVTSTCT